MCTPNILESQALDPGVQPLETRSSLLPPVPQVNDGGTEVRRRQTIYQDIHPVSDTGLETQYRRKMAKSQRSPGQVGSGVLPASWGDNRPLNQQGTQRRESGLSSWTHSPQESLQLLVHCVKRGVRTRPCSGQEQSRR